MTARSILVLPGKIGGGSSAAAICCHDFLMQSQMFVDFKKLNMVEAGESKCSDSVTPASEESNKCVSVRSSNSTSAHSSCSCCLVISMDSSRVRCSRHALASQARPGDRRIRELGPQSPEARRGRASHSGGKAINPGHQIRETGSPPGGELIHRLSRNRRCGPTC